jgi:PAS domain S-box-containing protein
MRRRTTWQLDTKGRITYMNPAARRRTGIAADAPINHLTLADFNPPQTLERFITEVGPAAMATGVWVGESLVWDAERREFPVSHIVIAHRDQHGQVEYFSGLMRDISAAKAAEQAMRESEHRLRMVTDNLPALICTSTGTCGSAANRPTRNGRQRWRPHRTSAGALRRTSLGGDRPAARPGSRR